MSGTIFPPLDPHQPSPKSRIPRPSPDDPRDADERRRRRSSISHNRSLPPLSPKSMEVKMGKFQYYKMYRPSYAFAYTAAHQLAMTQTYQNHHHRGGLDFYTLARGTEKSYSCSFLVNLDPDLLSLCSREDASTLDLARDALISHTRRIFKFITMKSGREVNQFCFGSTYVNLNPNYRRFDKMDPMTWKKEGELKTLINIFPGMHVWLCGNLVSLYELTELLL